MQPWYWRSLPLENRTGSEVFSTLFHHHDSGAIATLLESPYPAPSHQPQLARYSLCAGAPRKINGCPQLWTPKVGQILPCLQQLLQKTSKQSSLHSSPPLPFTGGWLGWLGYDLAWEIEKLPYLRSDSLPFPVAFWYEPECFAVLDHQSQTLWLAASSPTQLDSLQNQLETPLPAPPAPPVLKTRGCFGQSPQLFLPPVFAVPPAPLPPCPPAHLPTCSPTFLTSQTDYEAAVCRAKKYIQAGDIFQANLSLRFAAQTAADSWAIYRALQQINPSPFACYWQTPWGAVISCSPERLVQLQDRQAQTRPIAGTRSRGVNPNLDRQLAQELLASHKERAEHIMLVDLERNDLGRVCQWGSVKVDELLVIERYSHVMHLVSNITGTLRPDCQATDLVRAMFPGGTITGCPKVRCLEIIEELEPCRRSLFYGACGYLDWRGNLDLNILIRTLLFSRGTVWGQVGAGIVADSDPEREWHESLHKAQAQIAALQTVAG